MRYTYAIMAASLGMLAACSGLNEHNLEKDTNLDKRGLVERVVFEGPVIRSLGEDGETKASLSQVGEENIRFGWESTDTVGIYPDQGAQVFFSMADGVGSNVASFDGGGWGLRKNSTYTGYFPFVGNLYLERDAIPASFTGQVQTGVSSFDGVRFYLASNSELSESGSLRFTFQMLNTIIRIKAIGLPAGTYTKLSLLTDEPLFVQKGSFGLDPEDMKISGKSFSNTLDISLKEFSLTEASTEANPVFIYLTSAPVDLREKTVTVLIYSDDNCIFSCEKEALFPFDAGSWGGFKCEMEKKSVIFYTSSDNEIVTLTAPDAFGTTLVSNEYNGSIGMLVFDSDVTEIGKNAFKNCNTLTGITIPESVTGIGESAFQGCSNLTSISFPSTLTNLGENVFSGCGMTSVMIPNGATSIPKGAFAECSKLVSVAIPETVTSIGESAFEACLNLTDIIIPNLNNVESIGDSAFMSCTSLTSFTIPSTVTAIGDFTFGYCYSLASVNIPDGVQRIGGSAFDSCSSLSSITIPNSVTAIERRAFAESGLISVIIPENVTRIEEGAFNGCTALTHVTVHAINLPTDVTESTFANTNDCFIYVPSERLNAYKMAAGWSNYASRICDHVYVEMGNGMKWATTNVGAIGPDDYGDYFTWGGTEPVTPSSNSSAGTFTDTANAIWGGSWRMPTYAEWEALMNDENYDWTWDYAKDGYTVVSRVPGYVGNTIFLPAAGTVGEEEIMGDGWDGYYWSSSLHPDSGYGWGLLFEHSIESVYMGRYVLHGGCSVRPIFESNPNGGLEKPNDTGIEIDL